MELLLIWIGTLSAAIILSIHGAYYGALADACLKIGTRLEGAQDGTVGFQDAITSPGSTNARMINWLTTLCLVAGAWYLLGLYGMIAFLAIRLVATVLLGSALKADPPKRHFCRKVYHSMVNREADFVKAGDSLRAEAIGDLRARFDRSPFANFLVN
ncbi:MAG: hypothetical protein K0B16_16350 [Burkholderiaceae bacterium]|nr:hypothetical protein [Burkholderiaceae bacterium]